MSGKVPHAAFCEEYDEDTHAIIPDTRQVANLAAKRSKPDLRAAAEALVDIASDSGYSSRTAATVNSTQSGPSGRKSPVPLKIDTTPKRSDLERVCSHRKDHLRIIRPSREEKMQVGTYPAVNNHHPSMQRSPSRRRETAQMRHVPGTCWDCDHGLYHGSTPVDSRPMDSRAMDSRPMDSRAIEYPYYMSQSTNSSVHDYPPPSPQGPPRYSPSVVQDVQVSHGSRPRSNRSYTYHSNSRPVSFHGTPMMPGMGGGVMYGSGHLNRYEQGPPQHGPPPSSSAYANPQSYAPSHYSQPSPYFPLPDYVTSDRQERSVSRTREPRRERRGSTYGPPVVDYDPSSGYEDDESMDLEPPRRVRRPSHSSPEHNEDYYRMPPPPLKHKAAPHIIQKRPERPELSRKVVSTGSVTSERHGSRSMDMSDMRDALPEYGYRRSSRETVVPARTRSIRDNRRSMSYQDNSRPPRGAIEPARRRRAPVYDYEDDVDDEEDDDDDEDGDEIEEKQRSAEEYQASRSAKSVPVPLTEDALKTKTSRPESDSASQKSRSSRGSDARTQNGSGGGSKQEEDNNIVMTMNGVTMSFTQESVGGKKISVRTGDTGAVELNIEGKRPKKYLTNGSDYAGSVGRREIEAGSVARREIEDTRRTRPERRADRVSHRSSRSTYSGRY
ncbi:hypothetical protein BDV25DRAFT_14451 [Aspergillus avenaceus]|uniref:Uncharacterized protein n=1 Tax=Aspergillus avenaceus TaxID=36643 RepID=A0A5N6U5B6_ASPAV|nr:hypothetical protein BDV25DRAFT_14451 [Aspergillus avenaceus]